jgi:uncharacterized protein (DUF2141 family)
VNDCGNSQNRHFSEEVAMKVNPLLFTVLFTACGGSAPPTRSGPPPHLLPEKSSVPGVIEVHVVGIPSVEGKLFVELYDEATYFHYEKVLNEQIVPVVAKEMTVQLNHVPKGRYMVIASHDRNSNHQLDTNFIGAPVEAYGFSRGARGTFGVPSFESGAIDFDGSRAIVPVAIR